MRGRGLASGWTVRSPFPPGEEPYSKSRGMERKHFRVLGAEADAGKGKGYSMKK